MLEKIIIAATLIASCQALTNDELALFKTTGVKESNTGYTGWVSIKTEGDNYLLSSNGIPDHATAVYPNQHNPNSIAEQSFTDITFPVNPTQADTWGCLPMGTIAMSVNGIPMFNPYNAEGEDATEVEVVDSCAGHPDQRGAYHYHETPGCLTSRNGANGLVGVAYDGFPIYGYQDANGVNITSEDLDECHGREEDGRGYVYRVTADFPYILGCYRGGPLTNVNSDCTCDAADQGRGSASCVESSGGGGGGGGGRPPPPPNGGPGHPPRSRSQVENEDEEVLKGLRALLRDIGRRSNRN